MICLFGSTGLVGLEMLKVLERSNLSYVAPGHAELDLLDFEAVSNFLETHKIQKIIMCAGYTDVDGAEQHPDACRALNVQVVANLLMAQIPIIHFSTDYVFTCPPGENITEETERHAESVYGKSKIEAEELLEDSGVDFWNIRTSWIFGPGKPDFVSKILNLADQHSEITIVDNQIGRPTYAPDLAEFVVQHFIMAHPETGHYHVQNSGEVVSWARFAEYFLKLKGKTGIVKRVTTKEYQQISNKNIAPRPQNSVLKNTKINTELRDWKEAVGEFLGITK